MPPNDALALTNACLSLASAVCVVLGVRAVRRKRVRRHRALMLAATATSFAFLVIFVARMAVYGARHPHAPGAWRAVYLTTLFAHEPLAVVNVPLAVCALWLGLRGPTSAHREVARMAYPVWLFVLVTGVALYALLYVFPR